MSTQPTPITDMQLRLELVNVTPDLARFWLNHNDANRHIRPQVAAAYARDMKSGAWKPTAEPVKISRAGRLLDGQHRLTAIIQADTPVHLVVAYNVDDDAQTAMDSGAKRTAADALTLAGIPHAQAVSAIARFAIGIDERPNTPSGYPATHAEIADWVNMHPEVIDAAAFTSSIAPRIKGCRPTIAAYTLMVLSDLDAHQATAFWASVADQLAEYPGDPVVALGRRFAEAYREREVLPDRALLSMIYRAWNSRRGNKPLRTVRVMSPGSTGALIPVPDPK